VGVGNDPHPAATPFAIDRKLDERANFIDGKAKLTRPFNEDESLQV
jgi:hypothetical protein